jgi:hypothetical protein
MEYRAPVTSFAPKPIIHLTRGTLMMVKGFTLFSRRIEIFVIMKAAAHVA